MVTVNITNFYPGVLASQISNFNFQSFSALQERAIYDLAAAKTVRSRHLRSVFSAGDKPRPIEVFLTKGRSSNLRVEAEGFAYAGLSGAELLDPSEELRRRLDGAIVILNNADIDQAEHKVQYSRIYNECSNTIFIGFDTDNHHGLSTSLLLAAHTDLYAPSHLSNLDALARFNPFTRVMPMGVMVWDRGFLQEHLDLIISSKRRDEPLGIHKFYSIFGFRNEVVATLGSRYDSIGFADLEPERLLEPDGKIGNLKRMCAHKLHWVVPTLNDLSTRVFDILACGGIPVVPVSLKVNERIARIHPDDILFYDALDIVGPEAVVACGNALFDRGGAAGIVRRFMTGWENHGDFRLVDILKAAGEIFGFLPRRLP